MLHGANARYHPGTVVCLSGVQDDLYADELGETVRYDSAKRKWVIQLQHPRFNGKHILVCETVFNLVYCICPSNAAPDDSRSSAFSAVEQQGHCGRGLSLAESHVAGDAIFEEAPFFISATGVEAMWQARWHAYVRMYEGAGAQDPALATALAAFDDLTAGSAQPPWLEEAREAAENVAHASGYHEAFEDKDALREVLLRMLKVFLTVKANQFEFQDGSPFEASALYRAASLMNHSCSPTVVLEPQWSRHVPGTVSGRDGIVVVRAVCDLSSGQELCHNYGPDELMAWPLTERREYIRKELGFLCQCQRCVAEANGRIGHQASTPPTVIEDESIDFSSMD